MIKLFCGKVVQGYTDTRVLGAIFLRLPSKNINPLGYFIEHVVHEAFHIYLNCLMASDPIILNSREKCFMSPLRVDPRSMIGVFHATYVSASVSQTFFKL